MGSTENLKKFKDLVMREVRCAETVYLSRAQTDVDKRVDVGNHRRAVGQAQHPSWTSRAPSPFSLLSISHADKGPTAKSGGAFQVVSHTPRDARVHAARTSVTHRCTFTTDAREYMRTHARPRVCVSHTGREQDMHFTCVWECEGECVRVNICVRVCI